MDENVKGTFKKVFDSFADGMKSLCKVSQSVRHSLNAQYTQLGDKIENNQINIQGLEEEVTAVLAKNVIGDRPTGNGVGWNRCGIDISAYGVTYVTTGGLTFGWRVDDDDYQYYREQQDEPGNTWTFFIIHPDGENITENSTLRASALAEGWKETD